MITKTKSDQERIKELEAENKALRKCLEYQHKRHCDELEVLYDKKKNIDVK